jgi:signal transduction histidine kinase
MRPARLLPWPVAAGAVVLTAALTVSLPGSTYGGVSGRLLAAEVAGAVALLVVAALRPPDLTTLVVAAAGATWLVPEVAGWRSGPASVATAADAWVRLLPALVVAGLLVPDRPGRPAHVPVLFAVGGAALAAAARLLLVDPFLDPDCWRRCDPNPLLVAGTDGVGLWVESFGVLVATGGVVAAVAVCVVDQHSRTLRRTPPVAAAAALALALCAGSVLRLARREDAGEPMFGSVFLLTQAAAVALAGLLGRDRLAQWRLSRRLSLLAGALGSVPAPGRLVAALRGAVGDDTLEVRYWAPARSEFVGTDGEPPPDLMAGTRRVTLVTRQGHPVAALTHSAAVDGDRLDRALGAAFRLALENEQLRAATLAELRQVQSSRARIVERAQLERRRLERNLHDGAQQRVVSLALLVRMLRARLDDDAQELAARAEALTRTTVDELRRVARGIYPAVLADAGLAGAVLDLAESSTDLPVTLDGLPNGRYTRPVETTAYLVVAAAVAEARRCGARQVRVRGAEQRGRLCVEVRDDGSPGCRPAVSDLTDQVRALSGEVTVEPDGDETLVRLELSCAS